MWPQTQVRLICPTHISSNNNSHSKWLRCKCTHQELAAISSKRANRECILITTSMITCSSKLQKNFLKEITQEEFVLVLISTLQIEENRPPSLPWILQILVTPTDCIRQDSQLKALQTCDKEGLRLNWIQTRSSFLLRLLKMLNQNLRHLMGLIRLMIIFLDGLGKLQLIILMKTAIISQTRTLSKVQTAACKGSRT